MTIKDILETMDYGKAPENVEEAISWLDQHNRKFGHFIDGSFCKGSGHFESLNPATNETLALIAQGSESIVNRAVSAAKMAQPAWESLDGHERARRLYALARLLQKNSRLFATLETMENGKPIRESRDIDIPLAQRHFYYHAGMAQLMAEKMPDKKAIGVCGQIIPWNFPLLMLSWKIAPALAMGNTVVLKPAEFTSLTALLFCEMCQQAGIPKGVVNIITGDGAIGEMIVKHSDVDKIAFTGSTDVGKKIRQATAGTGKSLTLELGGKSPFIVFDDADLDSAVEGLVDAIWFNQGQVCCAGSRLLVQEGVSERLFSKIKARMQKLRIGDPLDKSIDMGAIVDQVQLDSIDQMVRENAPDTIFQSNTDLPTKGCYYPPTLITDLETSNPLMQNEIFGPVLVSTTFRTPAEAIQLANNTRYGLAASIWSENINLCLGLAPKIKAGVIWINGTNMFDASAGFGGFRESGFGREGGWEGLVPYTKPKLEPTSGKLAPINLASTESSKIAPALDRTAKLYIGGKQSRPDGGYYKPTYDFKGNLLGQIPVANRKDVRNAVEAAQKAANWSTTSGHLRAQILYYLAENLSARSAEFAEKLDAYSGQNNGLVEVEESIKRIFNFAAWSDKHDGDVRNVPIRGLALSVNEPVGTIGVFCSDGFSLLGLVSTIAAGLSMGNRMILICSEAAPLIATDFYQILDTSDVPAGVVNILTGSHADLAKPVSTHMDIDAVWCFSSTDISKLVETSAAFNLKRTWVNYGREKNWQKNDDFQSFLSAATETKTIWIPFGEG
ncbi:MAG: aldehyde dehydrogenase family protein [Marinovum sp.]|nr:aldehyde dehydrogenase family protein [Marinovum sp.]